MKALVVYCHPNPNSYNAAIKSHVVQHLEDAGAEIRVIDLYREKFDPTLSDQDWQDYEDAEINGKAVQNHTDAILWCDALFFIYPTWWYGPPAMLKGWLDRVLLPGVAFHMPEGGNILPGLRHIRHLSVFTTCGASWLLTKFIGSPGRRTIMRGLGLLCHPAVKRTYCAHYLMDSSTDDSRARHLDRVSVCMRKITRRLQSGKQRVAT